MAYYIRRPSALDPSKYVYWTGGHHWSDNPNLKSLLATLILAQAKINNPDGRNGGWSRAQIVEE